MLPMTSCLKMIVFLLICSIRLNGDTSGAEPRSRPAGASLDGKPIFPVRYLKRAEIRIDGH